jgi:tol-pal system protein YbgF
MRRPRPSAPRRTALGLIAAATLAGCMASKSDVRILQDELRALRSSVTQADTAQRARADSAMALIARANDSLRFLSTRLSAFQASVNGELSDLGRQLITIQELTGQSQRRLQELRASFEARSEAMSVTPPTPGDSTQPAGPGPAQLFQIAFDQMQRGSFSAARAGFQDLLTRYPTFEAVPAAQLYVGQAFAEEKNVAASDSVFQLVVTKYPKAKEAATALYKFALSQIAQKKREPARVALNRIVKEYPNSDEASLARDLLRTIR